MTHNAAVKFCEDKKFYNGHWYFMVSNVRNNKYPIDYSVIQIGPIWHKDDLIQLLAKHTVLYVWEVPL